MINNIYPPDHLLRKWESLIVDEEENVDVVLCEAFQAGADRELEACCEWLHWQNLATHPDLIPSLRAARRPKPPSLKEQALAIVENLGICDHVSPKDEEILRRAIKSLSS